MAHLRHGRLNHIFELPGVKYQLRPGPIAHILKKNPRTRPWRLFREKLGLRKDEGGLHPGRALRHPKWSCC
jgi:hypothetical protein